MKKVDYIIVGQGFAGTFLAFELLKRNKTFVIFDNEHQKASSIAAGVYNPLVLKRFSLIWEAQSQIDFFIHRIGEIEKVLGKTFLNTTPVCRIFHDAEERQIWLKKAKRAKLQAYLNTDFIETFPNIESPYGAGKVNFSGRLNAADFITSSRKYFLESNHLIEKPFLFENLDIKNGIRYKDYEAKHILFAEGKAIQSNPYFSYLPLEFNKGECLSIEIKEALEDFIYKKKDFLFSLGENRYYVGATYDLKDMNENTTLRAREELLNNLKQFYPNQPQKVEQQFAFRPITEDRRPIISSHPEFSNLWVFNGLGSRGTLLGAYFANELISHIEENTPISEEVSIKRFTI